MLKWKYFKKKNFRPLHLDEIITEDDHVLSSNESSSCSLLLYDMSNHQMGADEINLETIRRKKTNNNSHDVVRDQSDLEKQQQQQQTTMSMIDNNTTTNNNNNNKRTILSRLLNLADFNLKFKSNELESIYERSYLSVRRLLFIKYLFFLIVFTLTWLIYLFVTGCLTNRAACTATRKLNGIVTTRVDDSYDVTYLVDKQLNVTSSSQTQSSTTAPPLTNYLLFGYLSCMAVIYLLIFVFLLMVELNERRHRRLEFRLNQREIDTKVYLLL